MMMRAVRALAFASALVAGCAGACGQDAYRAAVARLDSLRTDPVEGIWQMNPTGGAAVFALTGAPGRPGIFELRLIDGPDWRIPEGTICGEVYAAAKPGVYDCRMSSSPGSDAPSKFGAYTATLELADGGRRLVFKPYSKRGRVSLHRWVPYFFRVTIERTNLRPDELEGAVRVWPPAPGTESVNL
ncbi:MAG: hypothetical protein K2M06_07400 [Muribaculaceae bacterium]|nr:hypothetical protein [Muribaculaceae bacterium]